MRYIELTVDTGYCGTSQTEYLATDMTDEELNDYAHEAARDNAEMYEYMVFGWDEDANSYAEANGIDIEEAEQMIEDYYNDAGYFWVEITKEEYEENKE